MKTAEKNNDIKKNINKRKRSNHNNNKSIQKIYGNFSKYYNYRLATNETDPRLDVLNKEWFKDKKILDIGCNTGELTIEIAKRYEPKKIIGIDLDSILIQKARQNIFNYIKKDENINIIKKVVMNETKQSNTKNDEIIVPLSFSLWGKQSNVLEESDNDMEERIDQLQVKDSSCNKKIEFPYNVIFKQEDIIKDNHIDSGYDVITVFSLTKWIHLYHGDEGIKNFFKKVYNLLGNQSGNRNLETESDKSLDTNIMENEKQNKKESYLIIEPQPWKSYYHRSKQTDEMKKIYLEIKLRPKGFIPYLINEIGFKECKLLKIAQTSSKGFRRPVFILTKEN